MALMVHSLPQNVGFHDKVPHALQGAMITSKGENRVVEMKMNMKKALRFKKKRRNSSTG